MEKDVDAKKADTDEKDEKKKEGEGAGLTE